MCLFVFLNINRVDVWVVVVVLGDVVIFLYVLVNLEDLIEVGGRVGLKRIKKKDFLDCIVWVVVFVN